MDLKQTLRELCLIPALSGHEQKLAAYLKKRFEACGLRVREDALGNCIALAPGAGAAQPTVMVFGHMDQLGFVVRYIEEDGFLRLERVGGIPERALPALEVEVQCRDGRMIPGVIGNKAHHATPPEEKYVVEKYTSLFVDIGAHSRAQAEGLSLIHIFGHAGDDGHLVDLHGPGHHPHRGQDRVQDPGGVHLFRQPHPAGAALHALAAHPGAALFRLAAQVHQVRL